MWVRLPRQVDIFNFQNKQLTIIFQNTVVIGETIKASRHFQFSEQTAYCYFPKHGCYGLWVVGQQLY